MLKYLRFEYFFIVIVLIWLPFQKFILKVDGAANSVLILTLILLVFQIIKRSFYKTAFKQPLSIYSIWLGYASLNALIQGYYFETSFITLFLTIAVPFVLMIIISLEFIRDEKNLLNVLSGSLYLSVVLVLVFIGETEGGRAGGDLNSNTIGTMATILIMLLYLKFYRQSLTLIQFLLLTIIPVFTIISSGSRTAFGGIVILFIIHFIINRSRNIFKTLAKISFGLILFFIPFYFILENTNLGERVLNTTEQNEGMAFKTGNPILDKFGDRGIFYYQGWIVFQENPITGVGLGNFRKHNQFDLAQHSEYMIQLSELGIIGFLLFAFFYFKIFKKLRKIHKRIPYLRKKREAELYFFYTIVILLMITATRMYRVWFLFVIIGLVIGFINKNRALLFNRKKGIKLK